MQEKDNTEETWKLRDVLLTARSEQTFSNNISKKLEEERMKKLVLCLTLALSLGLAAPVFANPFSDVPADHWAYDAIQKLAEDGIVNGNTDGSFKGNKAMTRYEVANIVAKAVATSESREDKLTAEQSAMMDRLVQEFGTELEDLDLRVGKVEKNSDKVKFYGTGEAKYIDEEDQDSITALELKLNAEAQLGEKTKLVGRLHLDDYDFRTDGDVKVDSKDADSNKLALDRLYLAYDGERADVAAGRQELFLGFGTVADANLNGAKLVVPTGNVELSVLGGKADNGGEKEDLYAIGLSGKMFSDKLNIGGIYTDLKEDSIASFNAQYDITPNLNLFGEYAQADTDGDNKDAYYGGLNFNKNKFDATVSYADLGEDFARVAGEYTTHDVTEGGKSLVAEVGYKVTDQTRVYTEYTQNEDLNDVKKDKVEAGLEFNF